MNSDASDNSQHCLIVNLFIIKVAHDNQRCEGNYLAVENKTINFQNFLLKMRRASHFGSGNTYEDKMTIEMGKIGCLLAIVSTLATLVHAEDYGYVGYISPNKQASQCTALRLNERWAMTAAHCVLG